MIEHLLTRSAGKMISNCLSLLSNMKLVSKFVNHHLFFVLIHLVLILQNVAISVYNDALQVKVGYDTLYYTFSSLNLIWKYLYFRVHKNPSSEQAKKLFNWFQTKSSLISPTSSTQSSMWNDSFFENSILLTSF